MMPKLIFCLALSASCFFLTFPKTVVAINIPLCDPNNLSSLELVDAKGSFENCDPSAICYIHGGTDCPSSLDCCYKQKTVPPTTSSSSPEPTLPPLPPLPSPLPGVSCSVEPSSVPINETFVYEASGLKSGTFYRLTFNDNITVDGLTRLQADDLGKIKVTINPQAIYLGLNRAIIFLHELLVATRGPLVCTTVINISKDIGDFKGQNFYTCNPTTRRCEVAPGGARLGDTRLDEDGCSQACAAEGKTFLTSKNELLTGKCIPGINCSEAGGISCDPNTGEDFKPGGVKTAIGCIPTEPTALVQGLLKFTTAAGGGIALLLMIFGALQMIVSQGNPDAVKKGHEQITSAVMGLLFIIFSVLLLEIIGVDILNIPGFSK